jgi:hypothetical protein
VPDLFNTSSTQFLNPTLSMKTISIFLFLVCLALLWLTCSKIKKYYLQWVAFDPEYAGETKNEAAKEFFEVMLATLFFAGLSWFFLLIVLNT